MIKTIVRILVVIILVLVSIIIIIIITAYVKNQNILIIGNMGAAPS